MKFGKTITESRKNKNYSQKEFADLIDVTPSYLSLIESDKKRPSFDLLESISKVLEMPLYYFLFKSLEADKDIEQSKRSDFDRITPIINNLIEEFLVKK